jgi:threonine dehydrogenase-like Zn-dependent dehydrogenase
MYGAGDVRVETVPDPKLQQPTDAVVRVVLTCVCGSDLHPYHSMPASEQGVPMGHEFIGVVEELGAEVSGLRAGNLVVAPFAYADNSCGFCREGLHTSCPKGGFFAGAQAEALRVPQAQGSLVTLPVLMLSAVFGTGHHAAVKAGVNERTTVTVVGDGAVGLMAVLFGEAVGR